MRIAIVNDLPAAVEAIGRLLLASGEHEIAWIANDRQGAVRNCGRDRPELLLMDLLHAGTEGIEATRQIMTQCPCAILIVTANVTGNYAKVFEAMGAGALDAVNAPILQWPGSPKSSADLLAKIDFLGRLLGTRRPPSGSRPDTTRAEPAWRPMRLIAIGSSAGGPAALARILNYLPGNLATPVVIVQHVDTQFAPGLANWLNDQSPLRVRLAQDGDELRAGTVFLAGRAEHLALAAHGRLSYCREPADCLYRPSIDFLFNSVSRHWHGEALGVLLTGMGRDGAQGLVGLRARGHHTIAQDRASSAVYGMPKAAAELRAAREVLGLEQIGLRLRAFGTQPAKIHA